MNSFCVETRPCSNVICHHLWPTLFRLRRGYLMMAWKFYQIAMISVYSFTFYQYERDRERKKNEKPSLVHVFKMNIVAYNFSSGGNAPFPLQSLPMTKSNETSWRQNRCTLHIVVHIIYICENRTDWSQFIRFPFTSIYSQFYFIFFYFLCNLFPVVSQFYESQVYDEYVIKGNAAVLKCNIPSFVSDHVEIIEWVDSNGLHYTRHDDNGTYNIQKEIWKENRNKLS